MKLSWLLGVIALIIFLFLLLGLVSQGETIETSRIVEAPIEFAWEAYHEEQNHKHWIPGFISSEKTNKSQEKVGSEFLVKLKNSKNEITETKQTILAHEALDVHEMAYDNEMLSGTIITTFNSTDDGHTEIKASNHYRAKNFLLRAVFHLFNGNVTQSTNTQYDKLKKFIEKKYAKTRPVEILPNNELDREKILLDSISNQNDSI